MTSARIARVGRSRFLIGIGILVTIGLITIFHNSRQQLNEARYFTNRHAVLTQKKCFVYFEMKFILGKLEYFVNTTKKQSIYNWMVI